MHLSVTEGGGVTNLGIFSPNKTIFFCLFPIEPICPNGWDYSILITRDLFFSADTSEAKEILSLFHGLL